MSEEKAIAGMMIKAVKDFILDREQTVLDQVSKMLAEAIKEIPIPEVIPGEAGKDGKDGVDGKDGTNGKDADPAAPGEPGKDGKDGLDGADGKDGADGADGVSPAAEDVAKAMEGLFSTWALSFERKADAVLEKACDKLLQPADGKDGRDALEIEDFSISMADDGRTVTVGLKRGETIVEKSIKLPIPLDKGVFRDGDAYECGDGVTFGGSYWLAKKDGPQGKPGASEDWRLAVKRGRDGKESVKIERQAAKVKVAHADAR